MPVLHDLECSKCGTVLYDQLYHPDSPRNTHKKCGGRLSVVYISSHTRNAAVHSSERTALYYSAKEGKWQYPATNNQPIPDRLKRRGYERVELSSLRALEQHGKQTGALSERAWFDRGSGRGFDD